MFQFINAVNVCLVNTFLHGRHVLVNWVDESGLFGDQQDKVWRLYTTVPLMHE